MLGIFINRSVFLEGLQSLRLIFKDGLDLGDLVVGEIKFFGEFRKALLGTATTGAFVVASTGGGSSGGGGVFGAENRRGGESGQRENGQEEF